MRSFQKSLFVRNSTRARVVFATSVSSFLASDTIKSNLERALSENFEASFLAYSSEPDSRIKRNILSTSELVLSALLLDRHSRTRKRSSLDAFFSRCMSASVRLPSKISPVSPSRTFLVYPRGSEDHQLSEMIFQDRSRNQLFSEECRFPFAHLVFRQGSFLFLQVRCKCTTPISL